MANKAAQNGSLKFQLNFQSQELMQVPLPVEIRKANMSLVKRALSTDTVSIEPGSYYVTTTLPAGQEIVSHVDVQEGKEESVELKPDLEDESPHETHEQYHFLKSAFTSLEASADFVLEDLGGNTEAKLRLFSGNLLGETLDDISHTLTADAIPHKELAQISLTGNDRLKLVQLLQPNKPAINKAVPARTPKSAKLTLVRLADGSYSIDMHMQHEVADLLCHYSAHNLFEQVALTANPLISNADAETLLQKKFDDPMAAAVGAYALLRIGELERLHDWTENLKNYFPWLPDGLTVRGEHCARNGDHDQALDLFVQLPSRGLPIFSDGLKYALDRLQLYVSLGASEFAEDKITQAKELLPRLQKFATYVDFGKPILTYPGLNPLDPDDKPIDEVPPEAGIDVGQFVF